MRFGRTLREDPSGGDTRSNTLLQRAGFVRQVAAGIHAWLPLGLGVLRRVEQVVRDEMNLAGATEILMPALMPRELMAATGRWEDFGIELYRLADPSGREFFLGPTHEELVTVLASSELRSYRDLPCTVFQIQWKYRYAPRARGGLLRGREFLMKDAYSFARNQEEMQAIYEGIASAYERIFDRVALPAVRVEADPGLMGGGMNSEFILESQAGETLFAECPLCGLRANVEVASFRAPQMSGEARPLEKLHTPGRITVDQVREFLGIDVTHIVKAMIYEAEGRIICALVRGDREINESKLARALGTTRLQMLNDDQFRTHGIVKGYAGPVGLDVEIVADSSLAGAKGLVTGANEHGYHLSGVEIGRDFTPTRYADIASVIEGDGCPRCGGSLRVARGIELGHIFALGTKYSEVLDAGFADSSGERHHFLMGCYGLGLTRMVAAIAEIHNDDRGLVWPPVVSPAEVVLIVINQDAAAMNDAHSLAERLKIAGISTFVDDRPASAGVKFSNADLIGFPLQLILGRSWPRLYEIKSRRSGQVQTAEGGEIEAAIAAALSKV